MSARAPASAAVSKLHGPAAAPSSDRAMKLRGSNGCSGWRIEHLRAPAASPSGTRAVASIASSSSPTGTAGGSGALVRSSLPL